MICPACRDGDHDECPEAIRLAANTTVDSREGYGGQLCDCQHHVHDDKMNCQACYNSELPQFLRGEGQDQTIITKSITVTSAGIEFRD